MSASTPVDAPAGPSKASRSPKWQGSSVPTQIRVLTARSFRSLLGDPQTVMLSLLMPVTMLVLFSQVFSSLATSDSFPAGVTYIDYLVPAILVTTVIQTASQAGIGLAEDMGSGVLARLRSLPIWMGSVLVARSLADLARGAVQLIVMIVLATLLFGFSPDGGLAGVAGAFGLSLVVGWALAWVFIALATWLRDAEAVQSVGLVVMFPLMFASSAFVTIDGLPGWLQVVAKINPVTYAVDASRDLALAGSVGLAALTAVAMSLVLVAVSGSLAARRIRLP